ncbi:MAG: glycosyltransferase family 2 protein [Candidatus Omnitrophota bacterium]
MPENILSMVIPAYNEEDAIASTLKGALESRKRIIAETDIDRVEIIVVNDGSRDRTEEIVKNYTSNEDLELISFEKNKGYGAAIKEGFSQASGNYVGFFDADGTCDPNFFIDLYKVLKKEDGQIALGSRVHKNSKMPVIRRIGNKIYAWLINILWKTRITDSASGMRLLRREALEEIYPLPDGLHFTPIMTCKALSSDKVKILEIEMPYKERSGKSKLSVAKDGYRFLVTIFEMGFSYRPFAFFGSLGIIFFLIAALYGIPVITHYVRYRNIPDDMIYRIIAVITGIIVGSILFFINLVMKDFIAYAKNKELTFERAGGILKTLAKPKNIMGAGMGLMLLSVLLNIKSLWEYTTMGAISQHWIYTLMGAFLFIQGTIVLVFGVAEHIIYVYKRKF